jgi:hypothetical protein
VSDEQPEALGLKLLTNTILARCRVFTHRRDGGRAMALSTPIRMYGRSPGSDYCLARPLGPGIGSTADWAEGVR